LNVARSWSLRLSARGWLPAAAVVILFLLAACGGIPANALKLPPDALQNRQRQTRNFDGIEESALLAACAALLQDMGYTIEESETKLGVIVASKDRSAINPFEVIGKVLALLTGVSDAWATRQVVHVSVALRPDDSSPRNRSFVRVTFQRVVYDFTNAVKKREQLKHAALYEEFFDRLAKSVFLEAQRI
jgi:hypothetical protein